MTVAEGKGVYFRRRNPRDEWQIAWPGYRIGMDEYLKIAEMIGGSWFPLFGRPKDRDLESIEHPA